MRRLLMVAYAFAPVNVSGSIRPLYFARHLPWFGYEPIVVTTADPGDVPRDESMDAVLQGRCKVIRVAPWRRRKVHSPGGRARRNAVDEGRCQDGPSGDPKALPDATCGLISGLRAEVQRYRPWIAPAVAAGLKQCASPGVDAVWATGDPWVSLVAGYWISRLSGLPLVSDIRDPWTYGPRARRRGAREARWHRQWERRVLGRSSAIVYTSPLTTAVMTRRVAPSVARRMTTITNGFADDQVPVRRLVGEDRFLMRFVGTLKGHRSPAILFEGLARACREPDFARDVCLEFIGLPGDVEAEAARHGVQEHVQCRGFVPQEESRQLMRGADVLVLLQTIMGEGADVIGGKAYEYLAARRPILAVVSAEGGDGWLIGRTRSGTVTGLGDPARVAEAMLGYWRAWRDARLQVGYTLQDVAGFSRRHLTGALARCLDRIIEGQGLPTDTGDCVEL